jgi:hypothetical protein
MQKSFFGIPVHNKKLVAVEDIKKLPFYNFWRESMTGSTILVDQQGNEMIYLHDWERFSKRFIEHGTHRNQKP